MARVSVLMPVFNGQDTLAGTIESVRNQTYQDWELIAVDDGSTDRTPDTLAEYAARDGRVVAVQQDNRGITCALNTGAARAAGEFIARLDCGDLCFPKRLERQVAFFDAHAEVVAVGSHAARVTPEGWAVDVYRPPLDHEEIDGQHIRGNPGGIVHPAAMIRTAAFRKIGGYCQDFRYGQDTDLWLRLAEIGRLANLPESLLTYRFALRGISVAKREEQVRFSQEAVRRARERRGLPPLEAMPGGWIPRDELELMTGWARQALIAGNYATSARYSWRVVLRRPSRLMVRVLLRSIVLRSLRGPFVVPVSSS